MNTTPHFIVIKLCISSQLPHLFIIPVLIGVQLPLVFSCEDMWPSPSQIQPRPYLFWRNSRRNTVLLAWNWKWECQGQEVPRSMRQHEMGKNAALLIAGSALFILLHQIALDCTRSQILHQSNEMISAFRSSRFISRVKIEYSWQCSWAILLGTDH